MTQSVLPQPSIPDTRAPGQRSDSFLNWREILSIQLGYGAGRPPVVQDYYSFTSPRNTYECVSSLAEKMLALGHRPLELCQMSQYEREWCPENRPQGEKMGLTLPDEDWVCG